MYIFWKKQKPKQSRVAADFLSPAPETKNSTFMFLWEYAQGHRKDLHQGHRKDLHLC